MSEQVDKNIPSPIGDSVEDLITFLEKTKNGEFSPVDPESLKFSRVEETTIETSDTVIYYGIMG